MAYASQPPGGVDDVYLKDMSSGAIAPEIEAPATLEQPIAWSHDGRILLVFTNDDKGTYVSSWSFAARALTRVAGPRVVAAPAFFSPRDDFIAYTSQESGRPEVYVTTTCASATRDNWLRSQANPPVVMSYLILLE